MYIDEETRRQGTGEVPLHKAKEYAIETGAKSINLSTAPDNDSAQQLYEKHGYVRGSQFYHDELCLT